MPAASTAFVLSHVSSDEITERVLQRSYHVATMDNDADFINRTTATFISDLLRAADEPQ